MGSKKLPGGHSIQQRVVEYIQGVVHDTRDVEKLSGVRRLRRPAQQRDTKSRGYLSCLGNRLEIYNLRF